MKPTYQDIKAAARYRWQEIHAAIGIDPKFLRNKHQPCSACGGEDRFRYDDKDGKGTFICTHWENGAGDGFGLVMHFLGCDFQTALKQVSGIFGMDEKPLADTANAPTASTTLRQRPYRQTCRIVGRSRAVNARLPRCPVLGGARFDRSTASRKHPPSCRHGILDAGGGRQTAVYRAFPRGNSGIYTRRHRLRFAHYLLGSTTGRRLCQSTD